MSRFNILFKVSGSVAAFKAVQVVSNLVKQGHEVRVVCTKNSFEFVGLSTWQGISNQAVYSDQYRNTKDIDHIQLDRWADAVVLCPATANRINTMASGLSNDLMGDLFLAHDFKKPYIVFPAMNTAMFQHPATKKSISTLRNWGIKIIEPDSGELACGEVGAGRLISPELITAQILHFTGQSKIKAPNTYIISAGGTSEKMDNVREITNLSTGYTGSFIAQRLFELGHDVTLICSKITPATYGPKRMVFSDSRSLEQLSLQAMERDEPNWFIHSAAVSDFGVDQILEENNSVNSSPKVSSTKPIDLKLKPLKKVIASINRRAEDHINLIAFKLTSEMTESEQITAVKKLFDYDSVKYVVHNDTSKFGDQKRHHQFRVFNQKMTSSQKLSGAQELVIALAELTEPNSIKNTFQQKETSNDPMP